MKLKTTLLMVMLLIFSVAGADLLAAGGKKKSKKELLYDKVARPADFVKLYDADSREELVAYGKELYDARTLSPNGLACNDCHAESRAYKKGFAKPYPHPIRMAKARAGMKRDVHADEFVQICINIPLDGESLAWDSKELAALTAYVIDVEQPAYREKKGL